MGKGLRDKESKGQALRLKSLLRDDEPRTSVATPHAAAREAVDVGARPLARIQKHDRNEELVTNFEEEEGGVALFSQPFLVVADEGDDLFLGETQIVKLSVEAAEDVFEVTIFGHFMNLDGGSRFGFPGDIKTPVFEVGVDAPGKNFGGLSDRLLAAGGGDDDRLVS